MNKFLRFLLAIVFVFITFSNTQPVSAAGLCYVNDDAGGANNGTSWTDAYTSLQSAIADSCTEIWVAAGIYKPHASDQTIPFNLENGTAIYGGFAGTETLLSERDYGTNFTGLSGDLNGNDNLTLAYYEPTRAENSYHLVIGSSTNSTAVLDGFTISGGNANGAGTCPSDGCGGGIFNNSGSPTLTNINFMYNTAVYGGGMYNESSNSALTNLSFYKNGAITSGGIFNATSNPILTNVIFNDNEGGGMFNTANSNPTITDTIFINNSASSGGGMANLNSSPILTNITFSINSATNTGGGMSNLGTSNPTLTNVTFSGNSSSDLGGGMYNTGTSNPTLTNVTFTGNSASTTGGGMYNTMSSSPTLKNVIIANSTSGGDCVNNGVTLNAASRNNLIEDGSNACGLTHGVDGNIIGSDPALSELDDNGGPNQIFGLQSSSPALNTGTNTGCPATDQRGVTRPHNGTCDIGSIESNTQTGPTFIVNTNADSNDDGFCDEYVAGVTDCTLREAMEYANLIAGTDTITFADDYTITLTIVQLPAVTDTMIINGNGAANTIIQANATADTATYRIFEVGSLGNLTLDSLTIRHGRCNGVCTTSNEEGGGIYNLGTLTITNSTISGNSTTGNGGGILNESILTLANSTLSGNFATNDGGGIAHAGTTLTITNSTLSSNSADGDGGGIDNEASLTLMNTTLSGNSADGDGGGIFNDSTLNYRNTLIANSTGGDCDNSSGTIGANTNNLVENGGCLALLSGDPNLGPLSDNGGSTKTHALLSGSAAIDAGSNSVCAAGPVNNESQNGVTRPQGFGCDIGAYELLSGDADVDVFVGGNLKGNYDILNEEYLLETYPGQFGGPVLIDSTNGTPLVTSLRLLYNNKTFSELMGVPTSQLLDDYWMPLYIDNATHDSQIRFTNTSTTQSTTVQVYIGGVLRGTYPLAPSSAERIRYTGISGGPVRIVGTPGVPILAGMRVIYGGTSSFDEIMAYPTTQLTNEYWFPFYNHNNVNLDTEVRIANTSAVSSSTVTVNIGGTPMGSYMLAPLTAHQVTYAGVSGGPVQIVGTVGVPLVTSLRLLYNNKTFSELMGVPTAGLLDDYSMPVYIDNSVTDSQVRFTNTSTTLSTTVQVFIGGMLRGTYPLAPSSSQRIRYTGLSDGPVQIVGTPGVPILAGMRIIYGGNSSFDEIMAYPTSQLEAQYWFPFYNHNNINLDTQVRIGVP